MKLKFCNKFWYVILDSFILCKGLKQLILLFLWHRGACCVQVFYGMNPLYQLGNSPLLSSLQMRTSPAQLSWREALFRRKHLLENSSVWKSMSSWWMERHSGNKKLPYWGQQFALSAVRAEIPSPDLQPCRCWGEGRPGETAAGRRDQLTHLIILLFATTSQWPTTCSGFSVETQ